MKFSSALIVPAALVGVGVCIGYIAGVPMLSSTGLAREGAGDTPDLWRPTPRALPQPSDQGQVTTMPVGDVVIL